MELSWCGPILLQCYWCRKIIWVGEGGSWKLIMSMFWRMTGIWLHMYACTLYKSQCPSSRFLWGHVPPCPPFATPTCMIVWFSGMYMYSCIYMYMYVVWLKHCYSVVHNIVCWFGSVGSSCAVGTNTYMHICMYIHVQYAVLCNLHVQCTCSLSLISCEIADGTCIQRRTQREVTEKSTTWVAVLASCPRAG